MDCPSYVVDQVPTESREFGKVPACSVQPSHQSRSKGLTGGATAVTLLQLHGSSPSVPATIRCPVGNRLN